MQLVFLFSPNKLIYLVIFLAIGCIANAIAAANDASNARPVDNETPVVAMPLKSVKKALNANLAEETVPPTEKDDHTKEVLIKDDKSVIGSANKEVPAKTEAKAGISKTVATSLKPPHQQQPLDEDFVLSDDDDSESLKTGFYFFLLLSSAAIAFIVFKIYRLRLSRAERKYGVQGDRSTQELTPLPISVEDAHSDEEDQILFEIQRQNIRIL